LNNLEKQNDIKVNIKSLEAKSKLFYLKAQFVPRNKHF